MTKTKGRGRILLSLRTQDFLLPPRGPGQVDSSRRSSLEVILVPSSAQTHRTENKELTCESLLHDAYEVSHQRYLLIQPDRCIDYHTLVICTVILLAHA